MTENINFVSCLIFSFASLRGRVHVATICPPNYSSTAVVCEGEGNKAYDIIIIM